MGTDALRRRAVWQDVSGDQAAVAELRFFDIMATELEGSDLSLRSKPKDFRDIYSGITLSDQVLSDIYCPDEEWVHGVIPDYAIDNSEAQKSLFVEIKRQDGRVEGKPRSAGRGNAHERSCKF